MDFQRLDVFVSWTYGPALDSDLFVIWVTCDRITKKPFSHELAAAERRILRLDELHILHESLHITIPNDTIVWNQKSHRFPQKKPVIMVIPVIPGSWKNEMWDNVYTLYVNNKVLKITMVFFHMCARCFFRCFWGHLGSKRFICQYRTRCCTTKSMSPPSYSKLSLVKIHPHMFWCDQHLSNRCFIGNTSPSTTIHPSFSITLPWN